VRAVAPLYKPLIRKPRHTVTLQGFYTVTWRLFTVLYNHTVKSRGHPTVRRVRSLYQ
jgi:hypothetical protein